MPNAACGREIRPPDENVRVGRQHLARRQIGGTGHGRPQFVVAGHLEHIGIDDLFRSADRPTAGQPFVAERANPAVDVGLAALPTHVPLRMLLRRWQSLDPMFVAGLPGDSSPTLSKGRYNRASRRNRVTNSMRRLHLAAGSSTARSPSPSHKPRRKWPRSVLPIPHPPRRSMSTAHSPSWCETFSHRQLTFAKVQARRHGQVRPRLAGRQFAHHHPIVRSDGGGAVGTACPRLVKGARSPHVRAGAMFLGVVDGHGMIAFPTAPDALVRRAASTAARPPDGPTRHTPRSVPRFATGFQSQPRQNLSDGVLLGTEHGSRNPLGKSCPTAQSEHSAKFLQKRLLSCAIRIVPISDQ